MAPLAYLRRRTLVGIAFAAFALAAHAQPAAFRPPHAGAAAAIELLLRDAFPADAPGAAVLVAHRDEIVHRAAYGLADLETRRPLAPDDVFRLASLTKQFTAVAVLQLVQEGALALDTPIGELLPDLPSAWHAATVEQLLRHTAGIPSHTELPQWGFIRARPASLAELLDLTREVPPRFAPGTGFEYSNSGYLVLGAILEKLSGTSYAEIVARRLAAPAGLIHTQPEPVDDPAAGGRVTGYRRAPDGTWWPALPLHMSHPHAAGALIGTVDDLWRWNRALAAGKLVDRALLARAHSVAELPDGRRTGYGYGWLVGRLAGRRSHEHDGNIPGFASYALSVPEEGLFIAILANAENPSVPPALLAARIARLLIGPWQFVSHTVPVEGLADYVGTYRIGPETERRITVENGRLTSQRTGGQPFTLVPLERDTFAIPESETLFLFRRDVEGRVDRMIGRPRVGPDQIAWRVGESAAEEVVAP